MNAHTKPAKRLTRRQVDVLRRFVESAQEDGLTPTCADVARSLGVTRGYVHGVAKTFVARGLMTAHESDAGKRRFSLAGCRVRIEPDLSTEAGRVLADVLRI